MEAGPCHPSWCLSGAVSWAVRTPAGPSTEVMLLHPELCRASVIVLDAKFDTETEIKSGAVILNAC